jgi:hypothetical protein
MRRVAWLRGCQLAWKKLSRYCVQVISLPAKGLRISAGARRLLVGSNAGRVKLVAGCAL